MNIQVKGARVNNLKNVDVEIPRNKFIVITGVSGSGKSSLAFDTLYAEGQRRYVESLSSYARQFLGRLDKPELDYIKGIPPAIAIEQKVNTHNPRSTVGTSTEIYDYLKLLYARIGKTISPISGEEVKKHSSKDVINKILSYSANTRLVLLSTIELPNDRTEKQHLEVLLKQGFSRVEKDNEFILIEDLLSSRKKIKLADYKLVIDRATAENSKDNISRLLDSIESAFFEGKGKCTLKIIGSDQNEEFEFSNTFERDGIIFTEPHEHMFAFNSPVGACTECDGYGNVIGIDPDIVIPNKTLSVFEGAIACWRGEKMGTYNKNLIKAANKFDFPVHKPYYELSDEQRELLWTGNEHFEGINDFFKYIEEQQYKIQYRVMLSRYRGKTLCPKCKGARLKEESTWVKVGGKSIDQLVLMPINELYDFFSKIELNENEKTIAQRLFNEINSRIGFLLEVGLSYLTLNRLSSTLSGGESQRINIATSLGSTLVGSLYILDEPSIGLHSRDTELLISVLKSLRNIGNTVIVVEHDEDIMRAADMIIDIGPHAGRLGGELIYQGSIADGFNSDSLTCQFLNGKISIPVPSSRRNWNNSIEILGARENNLKNINVKIPLNVLCVVTGVSGSGKSTLINKIFYPAFKKRLGGVANKTGQFDLLQGNIDSITNIELVDQNPIGKSTRSNPATYLKAYDEIRNLMADQKASKVNGFKPAHFSFNIDGGRCDECQGEGTIKVEMQFMADVILNCDECKGKRFKQSVLEVKYQGKNIHNILEMTVNEAIEFFKQKNEKQEKRIIAKLKPLSDVGLGYIKLGQASSTLSGGESQRVKLASFLANERATPTLFVFDEPTTGLHFNDIAVLLKAFNSLIGRGHSLVIIEHNMDVIKSADWIIDLGPEGGKDGGNIVFEGTPEDLVKCKKSYTGKYLQL